MSTTSYSMLEIFVSIQIRIEALILRESFSQTETCIATAMTTAKDLLETGK